MIIITTCLWDANDASHAFSRCYDESWVNKLHAGVARNLTRAHRFVCFTDRERRFAPGIEQMRLADPEPHYGACIEPFQLDCAQIFMGLDTVIVGNIDHLADYAMRAERPAIPRDPFPTSRWDRTNAVVVAPDGCKRMLWDGYAGENDMDWINTRDTDLLDDLFPKQIVSYKGRVQWLGIEPETRIVYFHGVRKPHELPLIDFIQEHWTEAMPQEQAA